MRTNLEKANYHIGTVQLIEEAVRKRFPMGTAETVGDYEARISRTVAHVVRLWCAEVVEEKLDELIRCTPGGN